MQKKLSKKQLPKFKHRPKASNKYDYGNVFIFGGSIGYFGAPLLSAFAAYRSGSGLVHIVIPKDMYQLFPQTLPEVMIHPYQKVEEVASLLTKMDACLFGPGLDPNDETQGAVLKILVETNKPLVIDASGLVFLKQQLEGLPDGKNIVITPHTGEARELLDSERPEKDLGALLHKNMTVVLKDSETLVAYHHHRLNAINGNPGMATAGSGDVLAGMILSYLGQGYSPFEASKIAVVMHQEAGNYARDEFGEDSMMASDIISNIPKAIMKIKNKK
ncbi:MAG TPA: NAD(P)H-hydrate dehydratase [Firmicutes bacterium]|jgi:NAD(P)H-hydrate epimerase|nr:NAD(P)H-hydrate dehydratase [Bacillota bacterium]